MEQLIHGDCLEKLKAMPDDSIDAIVTDPPAGIEFMGKDWDSFKDNKRSKGWACQGKEGGNDFGGFGKTLKWFVPGDISGSLRPVMLPGLTEVFWIL